MYQGNNINSIEIPEQLYQEWIYFGDYDPKEFKRANGSNPLWDFFARSPSLKVSICQIVSVTADGRSQEICGKVIRNGDGNTKLSWDHLKTHHQEVYRRTSRANKTEVYNISQSDSNYDSNDLIFSDMERSEVRNKCTFPLETSGFIVNETEFLREEHLSLASTPPTDGSPREIKLTTYHTTDSKFRSLAGGEAKRCNLQQKTVRYTTILKIIDFTPDLRRFLFNQLQDFAVGRRLSSDDARALFRYQPLFAPERRSKGRSSNPDYSLGIGVVTTRDDREGSSTHLKPVVFIGDFLLSDHGVRRMTDGIRISPELAVWMFMELPAFVSGLVEERRSQTMNSLKTR
jgi:hypothetical protein